MSEPVPALVTMHVWRVPRRQVPQAVFRIAADRGSVRKAAGLRFAKLLGTGNGRTFSVRDSDPTRWALLSAWADRDAADAFETSATVLRWRRMAVERWRCDLVPLSARGRWSRRQPFGSPNATERWDGPVAAVTRARIKPSRAITFWRAVPAVSADLHDRPGLRAAIGIGEAPVGVQGTFSVWDSADALRDYAYRRPAHLAAIRATAEEQWYGEELFARFAVVASSGSLDHSDPAGMNIRPWSPDDLRRHVDTAVKIYCAAMNYPPETGQQRKGYILVHTARAGFRGMGAYDDDGNIVGFGYGYRGAPGQWWHDEVRRDLHPVLAQRWLHDPFELCELHVRPSHQGRGIGQDLLIRLLDGCPQETVVLSTPEGPSRAWRLYRRLGFVDVRRHHCFAGDEREFAVLGRPLPISGPVPARGE